MATKKKTSGKNGSKLGDAPAGFVKVETHLAGFWKPEITGQSVRGVVGEAVEVVDPDGKQNVFYSLTLTSDQGGPIKTRENKTVPTVPGQMIGVGGKMLLGFLRGREGLEVYLRYTGLGPKKKPGQHPPKMFDTWVKGDE